MKYDLILNQYHIGILYLFCYVEYTLYKYTRELLSQRKCSNFHIDLIFFVHFVNEVIT